MLIKKAQCDFLLKKDSRPYDLSITMVKAAQNLYCILLQNKVRLKYKVRTVLTMTIENDQISEIKDILINNKLYERFNLDRVGIFGFAARGEHSNDIDVLVE